MTPKAINSCRDGIARILSSLETQAGYPYDTARELLSVGELKVCCEFACEHIADDNLFVPSDVSKLLVEICIRLGVDPNYYFYLTDHLTTFPDHTPKGG
ncbi:hypothetical protein Poly51_61210 [Rubripirellula tenax]|uniref:Uncharacterized protein n=1 Tax=Rubripirellula tenax TaxID=2528015 RepID=A0A5C6E7A2_9BACT|nr:hypothetical protein Poly51_61210 [Rubripirellula tenax]